MRGSRVVVVSMILVLAASSATMAGPYTDDLSRCLVESTTDQDRVDLVVWMFAAASSHPAVRPMSTVTEEDLEAANEKMADLMMRLLTDSCVEATRKAIKYEGAATIEAGFEVLGAVAGQELFASPEVAAALSGLEKHLDQEKLEELVEEDQGD